MEEEIRRKIIRKVNRKQDKIREETGGLGLVPLSWLQQFVLPKLIEEYGNHCIEIFYDVVEDLRENGTVSGI